MILFMFEFLLNTLFRTQLMIQIVFRRPHQTDFGKRGILTFEDCILRASTYCT